jgi:hypothetical protein
MDRKPGRFVDDERLAIEKKDPLLPHETAPATAVAGGQR